MKANEVNRIFTAKVSELLSRGYQINAGTMAGSQGEIAHIDLTDGSEILRVLMYTENDWTGEVSEYLIIKVGRCTDRIRGRGYRTMGDTIWNNHLETVSEIRLAKVDEDWFTTLEEAQRIEALRKQRRENRRREAWEGIRAELGDAYKSVALRWLCRQPRMKGTKASDIGRMWRVAHHGKRYFEIEAKGIRHTIR